MFRRKEDEGLKEDTLFGASYPAEESATVLAAAPQAQATSAASAPAAGTNHSHYTPAQPVARPIPEARTTAPAPQGNNFRPNAAPIGDMARNRMPEAKPSAPAPASGLTGNATALEKSNKSGRRILTVGNDILLKGEIATCDRLVIEGKVDATLNDVHTVEISETGSFKGAAQIEDAEISGLFEGDLVVRNRLVIYATGKVRGKITYGEIEIERGGELTGEIKTISQSGTSATRPARAAVPLKEPVAA